MYFCRRTTIVAKKSSKCGTLHSCEKLFTMRVSSRLKHEKEHGEKIYIYLSYTHIYIDKCITHNHVYYNGKLGMRMGGDVVSLYQC